MSDQERYVIRLDEHYGIRILRILTPPLSLLHQPSFQLVEMYYTQKRGQYSLAGRNATWEPSRYVVVAAMSVSLRRGQPGPESSFSDPSPQVSVQVLFRSSALECPQ